MSRLDFANETSENGHPPLAYLGTCPAGACAQG